MSSVSGTRESSRTSTVTRQTPSSCCSSEVTPSASRPVISASSCRARAAISMPAEGSRRLPFLLRSAIPIAFLRPGALFFLWLGARDLLLEDLALDLRGFLLADLPALAFLLDLLDLPDASGRAVFLAVGFLGDLVRDPHREAQRRRRK